MHQQYGDSDPTLTYGVSSGSLVGGDALTLSRVSGENVGSYAITAANSNYAITANTTSLGITPRPITIVIDAKSKTYGNSDPTLTYSVSSGSLIGGDALTLSRVSGENVGSYAITAANSNYAISANSVNMVIGSRALVLSIDAKSKRSGESDPAWTYQIVGGSLLSGDEITFARVAGEAPGRYLISASNPNYQISTADTYLNIANRIETATVVNGVLTVAPVQPATQATSSPVLMTPQVSVNPVALPSNANASALISSGLMMIPVGAEQTKVLETTAASSADKAEGGAKPASAAWLQSAQALGYTGVLVVEGGVRLPDSMR